VVALRDTDRVGDALKGLAGALERLELGPELAHLDAARSGLVATIRSYLIPRAFDPNLPLVVVFAGPTGSGKSTLINSITGRDLAATGALRPTTIRPLVLASPRVADDYADVGGVPCRVVTGDAPVLSGMVLVDTPDIDSTVLEHRASAETLIDNADVVVFVTSALRYADDVPWQMLRRAQARGTDVINVLNRVGSATAGAIVDFGSRLRREGLDDDPVTIPEHHLPERGSRVPSTAIRSLARRLAAIASDRDYHFAATFDRVLQAIVDQTTDLARRIEDVAAEGDSLGSELSLHLADRASQLYMGGIVDGLYESPPEKNSRWAWQRWKMANRREIEEVAAGEQVIIDRFVAIVRGDLRHWIVEVRHFDVSPDEVVPELTPVIRSAAEGWVRFVARIGEETGAAEPWLTEIALIDSATDEVENRMVNALFGAHATVLVDRARRELVRRLEVIYEHAGSRLIEMARREKGSLDVSGLRVALGAVSSTLAPVDA
jgi:energy-coupling factor transporter ATP-binding protein EcfA2